MEQYRLSKSYLVFYDKTDTSSHIKILYDCNGVPSGYPPLEGL